MKEIKMKKFHMILPVFVVAILIMLAPITKIEAAEGKPGQTVTVTFSFNEIRGLDGEFSFSDEGIFSEINYSSSFQGVRFNNNKVFYSTTAEEATAGTITVTATIKEDAAVGGKCTITLGDINITDANTNSIYSGSKSEVVNVVEEPVVTKAPAKPTATPGSSSQGNNQDQNQAQNPGNSQNQSNNNSNNQSQNNAPTEAPAKNNVDNNKSETPSSSNVEVPAATSTPEATGETSPESTEGFDEPDDSIEANAGVVKEDKKDNENKSGSKIWLILFLISLLANLLLIGFLLWRKFKKKAEKALVEDDTPIVDYDIDEDFDDDII